LSSRTAASFVGVISRNVTSDTLQAYSCIQGTSWTEDGHGLVGERSGMSLDEDERLRSDAEVERFLRSVAPGS
jgi:hypothetical protein